MAFNSRYARSHERTFNMMPSILDTEKNLKERHAKNMALASEHIKVDIIFFINLLVIF